MNIALIALTAGASLVTTPKDAIERLFAAFNRHDTVALQELYAPNATLTSSDFCRPRTGADVSRTYGAMFQQIPDIRDDVISIVIDSDQAVVRFTSSSKAPGQEFRFELMTYLKFRNGLIVEDDTVFDTKGRPCEP